MALALFKGYPSYHPDRWAPMRFVWSSTDDCAGSTRDAPSDVDAVVYDLPARYADKA